MKTSRIREFKSLSLAALLIASATLAACSSDDSIIEQPVQPTEKVYTMTIQATKGDDATTRGLYFADGETSKDLRVNWNGKEKIRVVQDGKVIGTLSAAMSNGENGHKTTLTGTVIGFDNNHAIAFYLLADEDGKMDYTGQNGAMLDINGPGNIEENYDFASYELTGNQCFQAFEVNGSSIVPKVGTYIPFTSQQAIVRFELLNSSGENLFTTNFIVTDNQSGKLVQSYDALTGTKTHGNITITPSGTSTSNVYYAALNFDAASDIELRAFDSNGDLYTYKKENVTFTKGKYYRVTVKMQLCTTKKLSQITPDDTYIVGWHVAQGTVGEAYAYDSEKISFPSDKTYAIIAYVGNVPGYFNNFLAIGMNDIRRTGVDGSEDMMWSEALTAANNYAGQHSVVIGSTTYNTSPNGSDAYDRVEYHYKDETGREPDTYPTNTATGNARQGWRLPTITDWRYVFEGLNGSPSATDPVGITQNRGPYADNNAALLSKLNSLLSTDAQLREDVYWTSSDEADNSAWFFSFLSSGTKGFFYLPKTNSHYVRPVFAY